MFYKIYVFYFYFEQLDSLQILIFDLPMFQEEVRRKKSLKIKNENNFVFVAETLCTSHTMQADGQNGRPCVTARKKPITLYVVFNGFVKPVRATVELHEFY